MVSHSQRRGVHFCWVPALPGPVGGGAGNENSDLAAVPARDYYSHFSAALRRRWLTSRMKKLKIHSNAGGSWQNIGTSKLRASNALFLLGVKDSVSVWSQRLCFYLEYLLPTESVPCYRGPLTIECPYKLNDFLFNSQ